MGKVTCESCGTVFQYNTVKDMKICPVCNVPFDELENAECGKTELNFGDGIELGENDSFDEDKIDFWWYKIDEPKSDGTSKGRVYTNCAKCGNFVGSVPYPIERTGNYLLIDSRIQDKCGKCGNELKNHILSKRPEDWVDPRQREMWTRDYTNTPKCPICSSTKIHKISLANKTASTIAFGVLAAGHVSKTYKCDICGSKF